METSSEAGSEDITRRGIAQKADELGKAKRVAQSLENDGRPTPGVLQKESVSD
jgi:hypothetical protein